MPDWLIYNPVNGHSHMVSQVKPPIQCVILATLWAYPPHTPAMVELSGAVTLNGRTEYVILTEKQPHRTLGWGEDLQELRMLASYAGWDIVDRDGNLLMESGK